MGPRIAVTDLSHRRLVLPLTMAWLVSLLAGTSGAELQGDRQPDLSVILGVTHVAGTYHFTDRDYLNEGADRILELGSRTIKLWFTTLQTSYPFNTDWPAVADMVEIAQTPPFVEVFDKPFDTYVLEAFSVGLDHGYWREQPTPDQFTEDERQFYELTCHLLTTYAGTGKTFVLQNWEGDWSIRGHFDIEIQPPPQAVRGMIDWLNARQRGVDRAREEIGENGVRIIHAAEVNHVQPSPPPDRRNVIDTVIPHTNVDMVAYSCWHAQHDAEFLRAALIHIDRLTPAKKGVAGRRVYIGEFGEPETSSGLDRVKQTLPRVVDVGMEFGCPYIIYWQLYCNEPIRQPVTANDDTRGFWLVKPDGSEAWAWRFLAGRIAGVSPVEAD
jgi:hypothetical protein